MKGLIVGFWVILVTICWLGSTTVGANCVPACGNNGTCVNSSCVCDRDRWCGSICTIPCLAQSNGTCLFNSTPTNNTFSVAYSPSIYANGSCTIYMTLYIGFSVAESDVLDYQYCIAENSAPSCTTWYSTLGSLPIVNFPIENGKTYKLFLRGENCFGLGPVGVFPIDPFVPPLSNETTIDTSDSWASAFSVGCSTNNTVRVSLQWKEFEGATGYSYCIQSSTPPCTNQSTWIHETNLFSKILLLPSTNYTLFVRGHNCYQTSSSIRHSFRTPAVTISGPSCAINWEGLVPRAVVTNWGDWITLAEQRLNRADSQNKLIRYLLGNEWFQQTLSVQDLTLSGNWALRLLNMTGIQSQSGTYISQGEKATLMSLSSPVSISSDYKEALINKWNLTWILYQTEDIVSTFQTDQNIFDLTVFSAFLEKARFSWELDRAEGFADSQKSLIDLYSRLSSVARNYRKESLVNLDPSQISKPKKLRGICSKVRIRIAQKAVLTRAAFRADMTLESGVPLSQIRVRIKVFDADNNLLPQEIFVIGAPDLSFISGVDGTGTLPANVEGSASWLLVPLPDAAPRVPTVYKVGGLLEYALNASAIVQFELQPDEILVMPDPKLNVKYFFSRYVESDDPFTEEIEPPVPFDLGVMIHNSGFGRALNFELSSGQPEIIDNSRGLLIAFKIIGCIVMNNTFAPSLSINFGPIEAQETKVARWTMVSSLLGTFSNFSATYKYVTPLGDPRLSLLDSLKIYELTRSVFADRPEDDFFVDFLVNTNPSESDDMPDEVHLSNYQVLPVFSAKVLNASAPQEVEPNVFTYQFQVSGLLSRSEPFLYLRIRQPSSISRRGNRLVSIKNSDTNEFFVNAWRTYRVLRLISGQDEVEDFVHVFTKLTQNTYRFEVKVGVIPQIRELRAERSSKNSILLSWAPLQDILSYTIQINNGTDWVTIKQDVAGTRFEITNLEEKSNYPIRVLPNGDSGSSESSAASIIVQTSNCELNETNNFGLCSSISTFNPITCGCNCNTPCANNGVLDPKKCSCTCPSGFLGATCTIPFESVDQANWWQNNITTTRPAPKTSSPSSSSSSENSFGLGAIVGIAVGGAVLLVLVGVAVLLGIKAKGKSASSKPEKLNPLYTNYIEMETVNK